MGSATLPISIQKECNGRLKSMIYEDFYYLWRENKNLKEKLHLEEQYNEINHIYLKDYDKLLEKYYKLQEKHRKASKMIARLQKEYNQLNNKYLDKINENKRLQLGLPHINNNSVLEPILKHKEDKI